MNATPRHALDPSFSFGCRTDAGLHVLLAEDDEELRALLAASLRGAGHRVSEVGNGIDLVRLTSEEALSSNGYDVIVSDVVMPGASGMAALMQINHGAGAPPVVLMTAFGDPNLHDWARQLGALTTLEKPFDIDDLKTVLANIPGARAVAGGANERLWSSSMKPASPTVFHSVLARYHGRPIERIRGHQRLGRDLGLDLFALVLVATDIEEREGGHLAFPIEVLDPEMTVDELEAVYRLWSYCRDAPAARGDDEARQRRVRAEAATEDDDAADTIRTPGPLRPGGALPVPREGMHVLVAEDDVEMRSLLTSSLRAAGYRVSEVADGLALVRATSREALAAASYDVIVSDIVMPGISGMGALMQLNYEPAAPPVVLITAFGDPDVHAWARQLGAVATFDKPFDLDDLKTLLANVHEARAQPSTATP